VLVVFAVLLLAGAGSVLVAHLGQTVDAAAGDPKLWVMALLSLLAGTQAFTALAGPTGRKVIISPTLCFAFAILFTWGLGPAVVVEVASVAVVAWRLRLSAVEALLDGARRTLAFAAASAVLWLGHPDPYDRQGPSDLVLDALSMVGAAAVWLAVYGLLRAIAAHLRHLGRVPRGPAAGREQVIFTSALLVLSPVLAFAAYVNMIFVPLVLIPLYAVQRMARLSADREAAARLDPLTGLANRTGLKAAHDRLLAAAAEHPDHRPQLMIIDIDRFKLINDALGHDVGDQLLVAIAERLPRPYPGGVARVAGDEFAVLALTDRPCPLADEVIQRVNEPIFVDGLRLDLTASIGLATGFDDFATLMRHADIALGEAKQRGDAIATYDPRTDRNSPSQLALLADVRQAVEADSDRIGVHYQPQVSLTTGEVEGVEALLRWHHPVRGPVPAPDIIALAEHTPVMNMLTTLMIDRVTAQLAEWNRAGLDLRVSLNVSARDLYSDTLVDHLAQRLAEHAVPPHQLQIEVTETALLADLRRAQPPLRRIADLGVALSLDDFGTGYSSLTHLRRMPISEIKIDQSFVRGMSANADDAAIVRSTIDLARALHIRTVAEGVEDATTWHLLRDAGCDLAQGWHAARPMTASQLPTWLRRRGPAVSAA